MQSVQARKVETGNQAKQEAMDLAEAARTEQWAYPSLVAELFYGNFRPELIIPFPEQPAEDKQIGDLFVAQLEKFLVEKVDADEIDRTGEIPPTVLQGLTELGAFGMKIDKKYGGLGFSHTNYIRALAVVGGHCGNLCAWLSAHQSIGVPQPLKLFGTADQKAKYLPRLVREISAFALTEPGVGSDPAAMNMRAEPTSDGRFYILNGRKLWCTNGAVAKILVVMARTPDVVKNGKAKKQISAFIVESTMPGFKVLHRCRFMGLHGIQNALIEFKDVKVPAENLIGGLGDGLKIALTTLNTGRLSLPAVCVGITKKCLEGLRHWTKERVQWGTSIGNHEEVAAKNSLVATSAFATEAMTFWSAVTVDKGKLDIRIEAAMAKLFCTEVCWKVVHETIQVRGGRGFENALSLKARGEVPTPTERAMRDIRVNTILEGSTEIMHLFIAREALDIHMRRLKVFLDPHATVAKKILHAFKLSWIYGCWYPRQWIYWGYWPLHSGLSPRLASHMRYVTRTSHRLARNAFHAMLIYGLKLERKQLILGRLVEIGTELFAIATSCSRARQLMDKRSEGQSPVVVADLFCIGARHRIESYFKALFHNEDSLYTQMSKSIMDGKLTWLEEGTIRGNVKWRTPSF